MVFCTSSLKPTVVCQVNYESSDDAKKCVEELHGMDPGVLWSCWSIAYESILYNDLLPLLFAMQVLRTV